jgi:hypothetical protein
MSTTTAKLVPVANTSKPALKKTRAKVAEPVAVQVAEPVVEEVVVEAVAEEATSEPTTTSEPEVDASTRKFTVAKGVVTVFSKKTAPAKKSTKTAVRSPRTASKSPVVKTAVKRTAARAPSRSPSRSPARVATPKVVARKVGGSRVATKGKPKTAAATKRRPVNNKPAPIDFSGIGIGPAKVKTVLMHRAFNPVEHEVRKEIIKAEARPIKPKPTAENPDPVMPAQEPQVPIEKLSKTARDVISAAEKAHLLDLTAEYEHHVLSQLSETDRKNYQEARKKAAESKDFNLHAFNVSLNKKYYDGFAAWCKKSTEVDGKLKPNDSYSLGRIVKDKNGVARERFNQWSRAMALVNKSCLRLSNGVRDVLACYLDLLVVGYARNGIVNCVTEGHSNLQLRHALTPSEGFDDRVPMDAFARTLTGYQLALNWIESCRQTRAELNDLRKRIKAGEIEGDSVSATLPEYPEPTPEYDEHFEGYVIEICRSVRMQMAESQKTAADKEKYHNIKVSENFKKFCSIIIYESILRIGAHLKQAVALKDVKTVNEEIMYYTLEQVSNICGIPFEPIKRDMSTRLDRFRAWCLERRETRRAKRDLPADADEEDEDEEETVEEEAVEETVDDEVEVDYE